MHSLLRVLPTVVTMVKAITLFISKTRDTSLAGPCVVALASCSNWSVECMYHSVRCSTLSHRLLLCCFYFPRIGPLFTCKLDLKAFALKLNRCYLISAQFWDKFRQGRQTLDSGQIFVQFVMQLEQVSGARWKKKKNITISLPASDSVSGMSEICAGHLSLGEFRVSTATVLA